MIMSKDFLYHHDGKQTYGSTVGSGSRSHIVRIGGCLQLPEHCKWFANRTPDPSQELWLVSLGGPFEINRCYIKVTSTIDIHIIWFLLHCKCPFSFVFRAVSFSIQKHLKKLTAGFLNVMKHM